MATNKKKPSPRKAAETAECKFADKIREYAKSHLASAADMSMFAEALGYGRLCNSMLASDLHLRRKSGQFLGQELERLRSENPELQFQFWTFTHERGNTSDRQPIIDLKFLRSLTDRTVRGLHLDGVHVTEVQGLGNHPRKGAGRTIMAHGHGVYWSSDPSDLAAVERTLNESDSWSNELGAAPIRIKPVIDAPGQLEQLGYYLFKPPYDVKMIESRARGERLKSTEKGYKPEFAARLLELLTQLDIRELLRTSGDGKYVRREWQRRLTNWHRSRERWADGKLPAYYFDDFWDRYRVKKKRRIYSPYTIIR